MRINPLLLTDGYKTGHHLQYPDGTKLVYSNFTPRSNKYAPKGCDEVVSFGQQMVMKIIHDAFKEDFFSRNKEVVCGEMKRELSLYLNTDYDVSHFEKLHDLGYLPISVKAIPEGDLVPIKVPVLTIYNTHPDFYWVTNYLETILSNLLWKPMTSATIAHQYRKVLKSWQEKTDTERAWFIDWQGHDFSMRGLDSIDVVMSSGMGHLTSFLGSDSLPAIHGARKFYNENGFVCGSVNATEHSVMCAGGMEDELKTYQRLLKTYPNGILSVVSDTWDLWRVITNHLPMIKDEVLARNENDPMAKLVIRPDSGDPADILCGYNSLDQYELNEKKVNVIESHPSYKGVIELLWEEFGGTVNEQGYKVLHPAIGAIYGDSITIERADEICRRLAQKGFASTNVVLGVGSFTYQFNTRDTFGFAMKATYVEVDEEIDVDGEIQVRRIAREIFKNPITDDGTKKSATGLLQVTTGDNGKYQLNDKVSWGVESTGAMVTIYKDGQFMNQTTLTEIREKLK
jgi:nicotinamide phosphoribosyltransferase